MSFTAVYRALIDFFYCSRISTFYDLKKLDCVVLHLPSKWSLFSQIYGGSRHDTCHKWFARKGDKLILERRNNAIFILKVREQERSLLLTFWSR